MIAVGDEIYIHRKDGISVAHGTAWGRLIVSAVWNTDRDQFVNLSRRCTDGVVRCVLSSVSFPLLADAAETRTNGQTHVEAINEKMLAENPELRKQVERFRRAADRRFRSKGGSRRRRQTHTKRNSRSRPMPRKNIIKALTISQPYASLIATGAKWVENRSWSTDHRGWLAIHAGSGTQYLKRRELERLKYPTGKVIAIARLISVAHLPSVNRAICPPDMLDADISANELVRHEHTEGPYCWILRDVVKLANPEPIAGKQGLWDFPIPARLHSLFRQLPNPTPHRSEHGNSD